MYDLLVYMDDNPQGNRWVRCDRFRTRSAAEWAARVGREASPGAKYTVRGPDDYELIESIDQ